MPSKQNGKSTTSRTESTKSDVPVPPRVYAELEALQQSGTVNMLTEVRAGLEYFDFDTTCEWIHANPEQYVTAILQGYYPSDPAAVPDITIEDPPTPEPLPRGERRTDAATPNQHAILDHLTNIRHLLPRATTYYQHGSWRYTTQLTKGERELYERFAQTVGYRTQECYHNSLHTILVFGEDYPISYVEGYMKTDGMQAPIAHAWFELGEKVIEPTLPTGPDPEPSAPYFGIKYDTETVAEKFRSDSTAEPLAPTYKPVSV